MQNPTINIIIMSLQPFETWIYTMALQSIDTWL
jgi:hypothetical protein